MSKKLLAFGGALLLLIISIPLIAEGALFRSGDQVSISSTETISGDVYAGGANVTSSGTISGDLYAGGGTVVVTGAVGQDAVIGGGNITVVGKIGDDLRAGGGSITITGEIVGDALLGGGTISISGPRIGGGLYAGGGVVRVDAPIAGDVKIGADEVILNAPIGGNVQIDAKKITLEGKAVITGKLTYKSPKEAVLKDGASVRGGISYEPREYRKGKEGSKKAAGVVTAALIVKFLMMVVGSLIVGLFFRRYSVALVEQVSSSPLREFGRGIAGFILLPIISVILLVTVIGIPFGILGLIAFVASIIFVSFFTPIVVGSYLHRKIKKTDHFPLSWKTILLGVAVTFVVGLIPVIGWILVAIAFLMTFGAVLKMKWMLASQWR